MPTTTKTTTVKRADDDDSELIDNMDILGDLDVLKSEQDWRMLKDGDSLDKYIKKTGKSSAADSSQGESHD